MFDTVHNRIKWVGIPLFLRGSMWTLKSLKCVSVTNSYWMVNSVTELRCLKKYWAIGFRDIWKDVHVLDKSSNFCFILRQTIPQLNLSTSHFANRVAKRNLQWSSRQIPAPTEHMVMNDPSHIQTLHFQPAITGSDYGKKISYFIHY